jgi:hypothetical protein
VTTPGQQTQNWVNLGVSIIQLIQAHRAAAAQPTVDAPPPPDPVAEAEARQQALNADAAQLLLQANAMLASQPTTPAVASAQPDPNTTLTNLLDNEPPTDTSTQEVSALLGEGNTPPGSPPPPDTTSTVADLLGAGTPQAGTQPSAACTQLPPDGSSSNVQCENLDHPTVPSTITFGEPQQPLPLYQWSAPGTDPATTYCQNQPNVPCEENFIAPVPRPQFSTPPPVTSPQSASDCTALAANWDSTIAEAATNHRQCLSYYHGESREGAPGELPALCSHYGVTGSMR